MKKLLLLASLFLVTICASRADLMWYEGYTYPDGQLPVVGTNANGTTNWIRFSGSKNDALVHNHAEEVSSSDTTSGGLGRTDDIYRAFPTNYVNTNNLVVKYASFTMIVTNNPSAAGVYFSLFTDANVTNGGNFIGKLFALTGTNLVGVSNTFRLAISATSSTASNIIPFDLATNVPYQVVYAYDEANFYSSLWVDPYTGNDSFTPSRDNITNKLYNHSLANFCFRQASGAGGFFAIITNLATATSFDEAATNVWPRVLSAPVFVVQPPTSVTNNASVSFSIPSLAAGQGLSQFSYQWYVNGSTVSSPTANSNVLTLSNPQTTDSGSYYCVVSSPNGLSTTSSVSAVTVVFQPVPPTFTSQPAASTVVYPFKTATLSVTTTGPGPISYQWNYAGSPISGATSSTLTISNITATNGTVGTYEVDAYNPYGTNHSSNALISITNPVATNLYYIRGLVDTNYLPTNLTTYYTVTGSVISRTNYTTSGNDEFFIQDATGGISVFYSGASTFRPSYGDVVTVTGPISSYNGLIEFSLTNSDPSTYVTTISSNNPAPSSITLPLNFTNSVAYGGISNALRTYGSRQITLTNVYFTTANGTNTFGASGTYTLTNNTGSLVLFVYSGFSNLIGQVIPPYAYSITGVMSYYLANTAPDRSSGYQFEPSDFSLDFVLTAPILPFKITTTGAGAISFPAVSGSTYSVYSSTNVAGPYTSIATGLTFSGTNGFYQDPSITAPSKFYRVSTP